MSKIEEVCAAIGKACLAAVQQSSVSAIPAQFFIGAPFGPSLTKILTQGQYVVTVWPLPGGRRLPPRGKDQTTVTINAPTTQAFVTQGNPAIIALSGTPGVFNFNVIFTHPTMGSRYAYYRSTPSDTLGTVATALSSAVNAVGGTATPSGNSVRLTNATNVRCNVGGTGTYTAFQSRFEQRIQVSTWTPTAYQNLGDPSDPAQGIRSDLIDAIINYVGTDTGQWDLTTSDGSPVRVRLSAMPTYVDDSQTEYNLYEAHLIFLAEYTLQTTINATQVGVIEETLTSIAPTVFTPITIYEG